MIQAIALTKKYNKHIALNNLNLTIKSGEIFCLLGQNGAGKTTTMNLFLGFTQPTSGSAKINGFDVSANNAITKPFLAYIPEVVMLYGNLTSVENLNFFSLLAGFVYKKEELQNFLLQVGLQPNAFNKRLESFSKGMRQKVGIAIALAKNAEVLLMDEPTSGLDPQAINDFTQLILSLGKQGKSILMATHDIFNAVNVSTHIGIMKNGSLLNTLQTSNITANELQQIYLDTIS